MNSMILFSKTSLISLESDEITAINHSKHRKIIHKKGLCSPSLFAWNQRNPDPFSVLPVFGWFDCTHQKGKAFQVLFWFQSNDQDTLLSLQSWDKAIHAFEAYRFWRVIIRKLPKIKFGNIEHAREKILDPGVRP